MLLDVFVDFPSYISFDASLNFLDQLRKLRKTIFAGKFTNFYYTSGWWKKTSIKTIYSKLDEKMKKKNWKILPR